MSTITITPQPVETPHVERRPSFPGRFTGCRSSNMTRWSSRVYLPSTTGCNSSTESWWPR